MSKNKRRKKITKKKTSKRRTSPRAIDTVPLPEKLGPLDLGKRLRSSRPKKGRKKVPHSPKPIIRTDFYRGHELRIETTYKITIDGKRVSGHLDVTNSGQVHYHPLPNRSTASAIDMVRAIIDAFPDEFVNSESGKRSKARKVQMKKVASKKKARKKTTTTKAAAGKAMVKAPKRSSGSRRKGGRR